MRRASVATTKSPVDRAGVDGLDGEHVERADAVDGELEDEAEGARGDQADAQAGERARADADADRGEVLADQPGLAERPVDQRRELLAVLERPLGDPLPDHVVAVVQRDRDQRGGGVEGEQHQAALREGQRAPVGGEPAVVVQQVEARGWAAPASQTTG